MDFLITGLPRSRTTWLANWLTWGRTFCYHEPLYYCRRVFDLNRLADNARADGFLSVGGSDSGLGFVWRKAIENFPNARWLVVRRPVEEAVESFLSYFSVSPIGEINPPNEAAVSATFNKLAAELAELVAALPGNQCMVVNFEDIPSSARDIWKFLSSERWSDMRWSQLEKMRINIAAEHYKVDEVRLAELN